MHVGMIATGPNLAKAMWLAIEVENLAKQYVLTIPLGGPIILGTYPITNTYMHIIKNNNVTYH
jgi:L-fuculose-phosphate aldolase